jgi:4-alpha-glucanotransferase
VIKKALPAASVPLRRLAALYGVQTAYVDVHKRRRQATAESLVAVLRALGASLQTENDAESACRDREEELKSRVVEPVILAWGGNPATVRLPPGLEGEIVLESGERLPFSSDEPRTPGDRLPHGYHQLSVRKGARKAESTIISARRRCYSGESKDDRNWGVFAPLYSLRSDSNWGAGNFTDLSRGAAWVASMGGRTLSTLPLFAAFLEEPFEPSPYSPASRLFWNEFYVDPTDAPEFAECSEARAIVQSADFRRGMALRRRVLSLLARQLAQSPARRSQVEDFMTRRPAVEDYARFRAVVESRREPWRDWPGELRSGQIRDGDFDSALRDYHVYVQFLADEQLSALCDEAGASGTRLYFDLPLGTSAGGYDAWRHRDQFTLGLSTGAPPDAFFTRGQNWGFPPPHAENSRRQGYRYVRSVLGNLLQYAGVIRIDHILGLHRLYCIPEGMGAEDGVYVRYPAEELYAVLCLESHRHKAIIAGEDLGTVREYVHEALARHSVHRTFVLQYELAPGEGETLPVPPETSVAALNTHDMPPFAAFWHGLDIDDRLDLGLLTAEQAAAERETRLATCRALAAGLREKGLLSEGERSLQDVLRALLVYLAGSPAQLLVMNLEDLWLETQPQNVPGTVEERVNWRRKARFTIDDAMMLDELRVTIGAVQAARAEVRG